MVREAAAEARRYFGGLRVDADAGAERSRLRGVLDDFSAKRADAGHLKSFAEEAEQLDGATPREVSSAVSFLMRGHNDAQGQRALVRLLGALPPPERGQALRLIDGQANTRRVGHLADDTFSDPELRTMARRLIDEARPHMVTDELVILCDIDDTVRPSEGHPQPGGRAFFPGARPFFHALDVGPHGRGVPGDLHFVTARTFDSTKDTEHVLRKTGLEWGSIAYGDWDTRLDGEEKVRAIEKSKVRNFERLLERNPRSQAVLVGDDTQADPEAILKILERHPERVALVLIHRVAGRPIPEALRRDPRTVVFDTYVQAARAAYLRGYISGAQFQEVIRDR